MPIDVIMPQMGESIAEGTVVRWMKKVGDPVERDEPILEISTDKVDAEIPSPAAGTLTEILVQEGETVPVNAVVARLSGGAESPAPTPAEPTAAKKSESTPVAAPPPPQPQPAKPSAVPPPPAAARSVAPQPSDPVPVEAASDRDGLSEVASIEERRRTRSSPLVRKIAKENDVDISQLSGSGVSGRVTKKDILQFLEQPPSEKQPSQPAHQTGSQPGQARSMPTFSTGQNVQIEPMSVMRKRIADHMVLSKRTSAHVSTVFEFDFTAVEQLRRQFKEQYLERGVRLTYMPFIVRSVILALREFPVLNASLDGNNIVYKRDLNIGIAVSLDWGLIVPVLKNADEKNVLGIAKAINDLGDRARSKKLQPDDVQDGTFTITNPGTFGGMFGLPIINQPQVAILGVGGVQKRPVVVETEYGDSIVIRSMAYMSLTFDHRLIDGAVADQFMAHVKQSIEDGDYAL
ncbi:MAG: dihydrolipoamide acetyltransferase family protein [Acidobacteriota bacterium]